MKYRPPRSSNIADEAGPAGAAERFLEHVDRDVRKLEELPGVGGRETDVGDGVGREIMHGQWEIFGLSSVSEMSS